MSLQTIESITDERQQGLTLLPLFSGAAALVLVVAAGFGLLWTNMGDGREGPARSEQMDQAMTVAISEGAARRMGGMAELYREQAPVAGAGILDARRPGQPVTVYIAGSVEQAEAQRALIAETAAIRAALGLPPQEAAVVVAASPAERERAARMLAELDGSGAGLRDGAIVLVELTDPAVVQSSETGRAGAVALEAGEAPFIVYVVESEEAAGRLLQELEMIMPVDGVARRNVSREEVMIIGTAETAATAWVRIEGLRATHGRDRVQVVDRRSGPAADQLPIGGGVAPLSDQSAGMP